MEGRHTFLYVEPALRRRRLFDRLSDLQYARHIRSIHVRRLHSFT